MEHNIKVFEAKSKSLGKILIFFVSFSALYNSALGQTFSATGLPTAIPDAMNGGCSDSSPGTLSKGITISGLGGNISRSDEIQINLRIAHTWGGDIVVKIVAPNGQSVVIINRIGISVVGQCGTANDWPSSNLISIRQNASIQLSNTFAAGTYLPTGAYPDSPHILGNLASLIGQSRNGIWTIQIIDGSNGDTGTLVEASITFFNEYIAAGTVSSTNAYCSGSSMSIPFTSVCNFNTGNVFTAQLSDELGSFANATNIGTLTLNGVNLSGTINATLPALPNGSAYRVRVVSNNPVMTSMDNGTNLSVAAPPTFIGPVTDKTICSGTTASLTATCSRGIVTWYDDSGTVLKYRGSPFVTPILNSTTIYKVHCVSGTCSNAFTDVTVNVNPIPTIDAGADQIISAGTSTTLTASCSINTNMNGGLVMPINTSTATGSVTGSYNTTTKQLILNVPYTGLSSIATAAHIHNATSGSNGAVIATLSGRTGFISGTFSYSGILNNLNASELLAGNLYIDIHNSTYPNGEIRGQINLYCANSFVWNPGNLAGQTVTVSPTTSTTYTVTGTGANGCIGTSNVAVIICSQSTSPTGIITNDQLATDTIITLNGSGNLIPSNSNVTYQAGKFIQLNNGFETQTNAVFKAQIGGCN